MISNKAHTLFAKAVAMLMLLILFLTQLVSCLSNDEYVKLNTYVGDYNSESYPAFPPFPDAIPENAEVLGYLWRSYYHTQCDEYLELKFASKGEFEEYLDYLLQYMSEYIANDSPLPEDEWMISEQNPYDARFIDCFFMTPPYRYQGNIGDYVTLGYDVRIDYSERWGYQREIDANFSVLSYSSELRTIAIFSSDGIRYTAYDPVPIYFERFSVPLEPVKRLHKFKYVSTE